MVREVFDVASKARSPLVAKVTEDAGIRIGCVSLSKFPVAPVPIPVAVSVKIPPVVEVISSLRLLDASVNVPYNRDVCALTPLRWASVFAESLKIDKSGGKAILLDDQEYDNPEDVKKPDGQQAPYIVAAPAFPNDAPPTPPPVLNPIIIDPVRNGAVPFINDPILVVPLNVRVPFFPIDACEVPLVCRSSKSEVDALAVSVMFKKMPRAIPVVFQVPVRFCSGVVFVPVTL
jgi:hypothetical protein